MSGGGGVVAGTLRQRDAGCFERGSFIKRGPLICGFTWEFEELGEWGPRQENKGALAI